MASERIQRQVERLLDEAEHAAGKGDWAGAREHAQRALSLDPGNRDGAALLEAAERGPTTSNPLAAGPLTPAPPASVQPTSFASERYQVKRFLGEGGKKRVYLAHDTLLDRDVAFALIKADGLDEPGRARVQREAQAMGRLGSHPHIVTVFDLGQQDGQPYVVTELMQGGDVEALIEKSPYAQLPLEQALQLAIETCGTLEFAHSHGIVHRDLKPRNVWLTTDPSTRPGQAVAKMGDFGLAVATDRSRLAQEGMMVGTIWPIPIRSGLPDRGSVSSLHEPGSVTCPTEIGVEVQDFDVDAVDAAMAGIACTNPMGAHP